MMRTLTSLEETMANLNFLLDILDPRGRCNRKGLLLAAAAMLAVEIVAGLGLWTSGRGLDDAFAVAIKAVLIYAAVSAASQRLHDIGLSAWRMLWAVLGLLAWALMLGLGAALTLPPEQMQPDAMGFYIVFGGLMLPMTAMLLWLHFAPGEGCANRFGPVPAGAGFARRNGVGAMQSGRTAAASVPI